MRIRRRFLRLVGFIFSLVMMVRVGWGIEWNWSGGEVGDEGGIGVR
jgi:hypothetical protein